MLEAFWTLAQSSSSSAPSGAEIMSSCFLQLVLAFGLPALMFWKVFQKAGQPGWASVVPIYNVYILCKIAGRPWWWVVLMVIPIISLVAYVVVSLDIAKSFGKGAGFAIGLILLGIVFYPVLGFGSPQYQGPAAGT